MMGSFLNRSQSPFMRLSQVQRFSQNGCSLPQTPSEGVRDPENQKYGVLITTVLSPMGGTIRPHIRQSGPTFAATDFSAFMPHKWLSPFLGTRRFLVFHHQIRGFSWGVS